MTESSERFQVRRCFVTRVVGLVAIGTLWVPAGAWAQKKKTAAPPAGPPAASASFERGKKLYESNEFEGASIELHKVVEGESGDSDDRKQEAEFLMGKTLQKMKFPSASLTYFDRIVEKGPTHPYYSETLRWLAALARDLADATAVIERIGKYDPKELEAEKLSEVRDQLFFLLGRFSYGKGDFAKAVQLFREVPQKSKYYVQAKLFEGATFVREYKGQEASEAFKEVLRSTTETDDEDLKEWEDLANLSLARTFYSTGQFELATKYYDRVSLESYDWPNSLFEASWANFMLKTAGYPKALGNIHTLQAPYFENFVKPESVAEALTVKATIYFYNCLYDRAESAIAEFNERVPPLAQELKRVADSTQDNAEFFEVAAKIRKGKSGYPKHVERSAKAVLSDLSLDKRFTYVTQLDQELGRFDKSDAAWKATAVANAVYTDLTLQKSLTISETGDLARQRISRLVNELAQLIRRTIKIEYEILQGQKGTLQREIVEEQQITKDAKSRDIGNVRVDDEHEYWPFVGEYWRDELGYYRVKLQNRCDKTAPEGAPTGPTEQ
jgi:tetratricopeptide (TPR) repeat protein